MLRNVVASQRELQSRWVTAELSDLSIRGHCYMELIEKDERGATVAKMRANIWSNRLYYIQEKFRQATGRELQSGMKVMLRGTANFHEQYGISFNITDIDPSYTLGDLERLRREILAALAREGVLNNNKATEMPMAPQRIAIISAEGAAGYGDFMNQLMGNSYGIVFYPVLFNAVMQGDRTAPTVLAALDRIEQTIDLWDCVVIIRGGGATTDLNGFDNLELARRVATFAIPIIVGIGHERDRTVLDEIAHTRVKTPTAAAEWLIGNALETWQRVNTLMREITTTATSLVAGSKQQLSQLETLLHTSAQARLSQASSRLAAIQSLLPSLTSNRLQQARLYLDGIRSAIPAAVDKKLAVATASLDAYGKEVKLATTACMERETSRLERLAQLSEVLSPTHTLKRGYTLTLLNGKAVRSAADIPSGATFTTRFADGDIDAQRQ
jgi:exodeoxyribonuclease VII large subunit